MAELVSKSKASFCSGISKFVTEDGRVFISTDFSKTWVEMTSGKEEEPQKYFQE